MILGHQDMTQLNAEIKEAIINNARNKIVFNAKSQDAGQLAQELGGYFNKDDVTGLPNYEAIASILTPVGPSGPVTVTTRKPAPSTRNANKVRDLSRKQYGREAVEVYREMERRYQPAEQPSRPRPKV